MKFKLVTTLLAIGAITPGAIATTSIQAKAENPVQFVCGQGYDQQSARRAPTTFAWTPTGKKAVIRWVKDLGDYTPQERCDEVSPRFQKAYDNGTLNLITNGTMNDKPVICTASEIGESCHTLLMTLRSPDESFAILNDLKDILNGRQVGPVRHSSGTPQVYYQINIDDFLRNAPVEKPDA